MTIRLDLDVNATGTGSVTNFYEQTPALLFPSASLSTINQAGATITEATVTLTGALATETLALDATGAALAAANGVSAAYNASSGVFTLQGADTLADSTWTSLLEHIAYNNTAENPAGPRSVTVVASNNNLAVSALATDLISVTPVNDAPSGANKAVTVSKGSAYTLAASDFGFTDAKDTPANALAGVKLTTVASGLLLNGAAVSAGTVVSVSDITAGLLTFNGTANASFTFQVQDNGGTANGGVDLDPTARSFGFTVDTAPAASFTTPTYSAAEGTALNLRTGNLVVSDADGTTSSETVTLSVGEGTLTAAAGSSGVTITGSGTPTLTLKGTVAQLSNLFSTTAGQGTLTYLDSVAAPSASTTLTMTAVDAFGLAASPASASVAISPTNNAPVNTVPSGTTILANNASRAITGLAVSDADAGGAANLTTTLTATHGTVAAGAVAGGAVVAGSGTTALTLTGSVAQINATLAGSNVVFTPDAAYTGAATLTVLTNDAGNTGSGGAKTDSDAVALTIGAPPVVDLNGVAAGTGSSVAYTEKAPAVLIAPSATVTDADNTVLGWNGWVRVSFNGTGSAGDVLTIRNQGTGANQIGFDGTFVTWGGAAMGQIDSAFNGKNGTDLLFRSGGALNAENNTTPASLSALMENLLYLNTSSNPSTAPRSITVTTTDGTGFPNFTNLTSNAPIASVAFTGVNDAPVLSTHLGSVGYTEGGTPVPLLSSLTVSDPDLPANFVGGHVTVSLADTVNGDEILLAPGGAVTVSAGTVSVAGVAIGTVSAGSLEGGSPSATVMFNTGATSANVNALLEALAYHSTSTAPTAQVRTATVVFDDGGNTGSGGPLQDAASIAVNVVPVPTLSMALASDTGSSSSDGYTSKAGLIGISDTTGTITFTEGATVLGTTSATAGTAWTFTPALPDGGHTIVATETDLAGHTGNASVAFTLDTAAPTVSSVIDAPANGDLGIGSTVTLTMAMNEAVTVSGAPSLLLNNGGTAKYVSGSGGSALTFSYTVGSGQSTSDLAVKSVNLAAGAITDLAGNTGILSGAAVNPAGRLIIDTTSVRAGLVGSPANTTLVGTNAASVFDISAGGATYSVTGGSGNDMIVAGPSLIATDTINGGGGSNSMLLWGDYSGGLTLGPSTVTNVQTFTFADGFNYALTLNAATVASGKSLTLDASTLAPINAATLDGSGVGAGRTLSFLGGSGNDVLTGGGGTNQMYGGAGADVMNAGAGADVFLYRAATDSPFGGPDDMIAGFVPGTDKIDLRALLLTNKTVLDVASGSFSGNFAGNGVAIDYGVGGAGTAQVYVDANKSGSLGSGDMLINVTGVAAHSLTGSSFLM